MNTTPEGTPLPPHATNWEIHPHPINPDTQVLIFYVDDQPVTHFEITQDNLEELIDTLANILPPVSQQVTHWYLRDPLIQDTPPVMTFANGATVLATLPLTEPNLKTLVKQLLPYYNPNSIWKLLGRFTNKHPRIAYTIYSLAGIGLLAGVVSYFATLT